MKYFVQNINHQFYNFIQKYDMNDDNIIRKIIHTNTVADYCFKIACHFNFSKKDRKLAYLCGILHDIGRFEQWKIYKTYEDIKSVDHGELSFEMSSKFDLSMISEKDKKDVLEAVRNHTTYKNKLNKRAKMFHRILLNADAFANVLNSANGAQRMTKTRNGYSQEIYDAFFERKVLRNYRCKTKLDRVLMLSACLYYVEFDCLRKEIMDNNLIDAMYDSLKGYLNKEDVKVYRGVVELLKDKYLTN